MDSGKKIGVQNWAKRFFASGTGKYFIQTFIHHKCKLKELNLNLDLKCHSDLCLSSSLFTFKVLQTSEIIFINLKVVLNSDNARKTEKGNIRPLGKLANKNNSI